MDDDAQRERSHEREVASEETNYVSDMPSAFSCNENKDDWVVSSSNICAFQLVHHSILRFLFMFVYLISLVNLFNF